jgi:5-hydroxyisourate hydrolase
VSEDRKEDGPAGEPGTSVSTHVLDSVSGRPAAGIAVVLERRDGDTWAVAGGGTTNADGRVPSLAAGGTRPGVHRLTFATGDWFAAARREAFYPEVTIAFTVRADDDHLHVPLLLAPYAYSTYRGS